MTIPIYDSKSKSPRQSQIVTQIGKVFFSDDGSTALEVALKLAYEFTRRTRGSGGASVVASRRRNFFPSKGRITATPWARSRSATLICSTRPTAGLLFKTDKVMSPYCYRCPFNRARPERADAREYRKCNWECVGRSKKSLRRKSEREIPTPHSSSSRRCKARRE